MIGARLPSVDRLIRAVGTDEYGHEAVAAAARGVLDAHRSRRQVPTESELIAEIAALIHERMTPKLRRVFNLTGTVLHTNLGRAQLSEAAVAHASMAMREACALEFDLDGAARGDRDTIIEDLLCELTGAEAATVVNNNAAAVLLVLAALAENRAVIVSRGELVEIGGAFRIPDVMRAAHAQLIEVGTTNRTHARDYAQAIGAETAALMKVHASNYRITGFTADVAEAAVARIAHDAGLPFLVDLGAGSLIDLTPYGLPKEPMPRDAIAAGADVVTFSGDKLLGGPQAGLIVGRRDLIARIRKHPMKRALRVSKLTLAALEATLLVYRTPDRLTRDLPTLRLLTRTREDLRAVAGRIAPAVAAALGAGWMVDTVEVASQVGSGSLPGEVLPSIALAIASEGKSGKALEHLSSALRALPVPVIGRIAEDRLLLDLRCLEDEAAFAAQLGALAL